ncbi:MAG: hypothetical protein WA628_07870 [Terriglobales bacterium]
MKLGTHVLGGQFVSTGSRASAFKRIVGKKLNVSAKSVGPNVMIQILFKVGRELGLAP